MFVIKSGSSRRPALDGIKRDGSRKMELDERMAGLETGRMGTSGEPGQGLDGARFREAMSRVAAAVHIVTTGGPAGLGGITATSVASITVEPPMMLFCINKASPTAARIIENGVFCINTLASSHEDLANIFAGRTGSHLDARFTSGEWIKLLTGAPVLKNAAAIFDCRLAEVKEVMTHFIMIGAVEAVDHSQQNSNLTYAHRNYGLI
jgi:flavin reductase